MKKYMAMLKAALAGRAVRLRKGGAGGKYDGK